MLLTALCIGSSGADADQIPGFKLSCESFGTQVIASFELAYGSFNSFDIEFELSDSVKCVSIKKSPALKDFCAENEDSILAFNTEEAIASFASNNSFDAAGPVLEIEFSVPENAVSTVRLKVNACAVSSGDDVEEVKPGVANGTLTIDTRHFHSYVQVERAEPTCTQEGYIRYACSCGDYYIEKIGAKGHSFGEWTLSRRPTTSTPGEESCICSSCRAVKTRAVPRLRIPSVKLEDMNVYCGEKNTVIPVISNPDNLGFSVKYESSDEKILKIDDSGTFTASKRGTAKIKCVITDEFGGVYEAECTVKADFTFWQWVIYIITFGWIRNR